MKKLWLVVALATLGGLTGKTFADVQNIRLSGDIRIRGYYLNGEAFDEDTGKNDKDASFISQRTRVSVEADLEDHVLVVVTLKAEGKWGDGNLTSSDAGAGSQQADGSVNRRWGVGVTEAYVQFNEVFYTPATLKIGRQYLQYGRGLILSSVEQEYNYDAARLVLDYYPLTVDIVGAELVNNQSFGGTSTHAGSSDLLFINTRYELSDSAIKDVEAYFGWVSHTSGTNTAFTSSSRVPPSTGGSSPLLIGARADVNPTGAIQTWFEAAYEFGGDGAGGNSINAVLLNLGGKFTMKDTQWVPMLNANYTFASGGGKGQDASTPTPGAGEFRPWFDYADGYNGYVFEPALTDIHIFNLGGSVKPYENTTLALQGYYYLRADRDGPVGSNGNVDWGGPSWSSQPSYLSTGQELGWEFDAILGYDYSKDVRMQLVYGMFLPGGAYKDPNIPDATAISRTVNEVRAEVNVKF